jgi:ubiquinone/menaquinone biosynthesis C-methylase UbiE
MIEISRSSAKEVASHLADPSLKKMLDVGAGPGTFTLELLKICPALHATLLDLPASLNQAKKQLSSDSLKKRIQYVAGDYHRTSFDSKKEKFDLILMSHVMHNEDQGSNKQLLKKAFDALQKGGKVAIHDFVLNTDGCSPLFSAVYSVHLLVYTEKGMAYKQNEYLQWLRDTGFKPVQCYPISPGSITESMLMIGYKP